MVRGGYKYVPKELLEELNSIKTRYNFGDAESFREIARNSRIGREIKQTIDINGRRKR